MSGLSKTKKCCAVSIALKNKKLIKIQILTLTSAKAKVEMKMILWMPQGYNFEQFLI
jgi:hypothetical protein